MAKFVYSKLGLAPNKEVKTFDYNGQVVEVIQCMPLEKKLNILTNVINNSGDDKGFYNRAKVEFNIILEIIFAYTNIIFTEKQKADRMKLYDALVGSGFWNYVKKVLPDDEFEWFNRMTYFSIDKIYEYRNSVYGILDAMATDYKDLEFDAEKLAEDIGNPENAAFLKEVVTKLG
jgi:superfamily I DNA and/or RNA helicase